jgi:hypothetical protein
MARTALLPIGQALSLVRRAIEAGLRGRRRHVRAIHQTHQASITSSRKLK